MISHPPLLAPLSVSVCSGCAGDGGDQGPGAAAASRNCVTLAQVLSRDQLRGRAAVIQAS